MNDRACILPLAVEGVIAVATEGPAQLDVSADGMLLARIASAAVPGARRVHQIDVGTLLAPGARVTIEAGAARLVFRRGGWSGVVQSASEDRIAGQASDEAEEPSAVRVVALCGGKVVAEADADGRDGAFELVLPEALTAGPRRRLTIGIAGSDFVLDGGEVAVGRPAAAMPPATPRAAARPMRVALRTATPNAREAHEWGDHHFALSLKRAFEAKGWHAAILMRDSDPAEAADCEATLTIRGRQNYPPVPGRINLLWIISHPDRTPVAECDSHDHVFVASDRYAATLAKRSAAPVSVLHQATDPTVFSEPEDRASGRACLFVGNSRMEWRRMVRWCVERSLPLELWGGRWDGLVPPGMLRGPHVPNYELGRLYADCAVLLNDHWDTMLEEGFLSNRLFDASAVAAPVITDPVAGLSEVFADTILTARTADELAVHVRAILADPEAARARAREAQRIVLGGHTFAHRAATIIETVERLAAR